jgi:transcriptional regulator with XRE-family HTH domain
MDDWDRLRAELLDDPATLEAYEQRRPAYEFAGKLIELRAALGLSQRELATKARMTQPEIARLESGAVQPTWDTISRVLGAVDAEVDIKVRDRRGKLLKVSVKPAAAPARRRARSATTAKASERG